MKLDVRQLSNQSTLSWSIYPIFEGRCLRFLEKHQIDFDPELFRTMLRARFNDQVTPNAHRLIVFIDDFGFVRGHFLAWFDVTFGLPYLHVNQLECDDGFTVSNTMEEMFSEMRSWAESLNRALPEGARRIEYCEFWTWHRPEIFARYLRPGCELKVSRYVLRYAIEKTWEEPSLNASAPKDSGSTSTATPEPTLVGSGPEQEAGTGNMVARPGAPMPTDSLTKS